jgi:hypothetical protein
MRNDQSRKVEECLRAEFPRTDAYRYNSASIRVRVINDRFADLAPAERDALVEPLLRRLPPRTQEMIVNLLTVTPDEAESPHHPRYALRNLEFEDPSPSLL